MIHVRLELSWRPMLVIRFRDEAGEFADDVLESSQRPDVIAPWIEQAGTNSRFARVIKDELHFWTTLRQLDDCGQHRMLAADIETQFSHGQFANAADEFRTRAVIRILLMLEMMA